MKQFQQKFIEEVSEMMSELEHNLLTFEKNPDDKNLIDSIFRSMHTLKGLGGMFGYDSIVELTHKVESIYAKIQNGEISVSEKIINLTFSATDLILKLLYDINLEDVKLKKQFDKTIEELSDFFSEEEKIEERTRDNKLKVFYVRFEPDVDIEQRGINFKTIFKELNELGKLKMIPKPTDNPEKYSLSWEIYVACEKDISDIEEVLMFVDMESTITLLSSENLLLNHDFVDILNKSADKPLFTSEELLKIAEDFQDKKSTEDEENQTNVDLSVQTKSTLRVDAEKLDDLMNRVSELITLKSEIKLVASMRGYKEITELSEKLELITSKIREDVFEIRLIPLESIRINFERLIRDTSILLKKETQFTTEGLHTELDKTIVDRISAPLMHIIRNSIDHGIESVQIRAQRGKTAHGNVKLKAYKYGSIVRIEVSDDGGGIDKELLLQKAIAKKLIRAEEKLSEKEIFNLIFASGLSTAVNLSEVLGRGVGMDVVKNEISKLRGEIEIESTPGKGTTIILKLPLSLSIIDTLLVQSGEMFFSVPLEEIIACMLTDKKELDANVNKYLKLNNELVPYINLREVFSIKEQYSKTEKAIIVKRDNKNTAIVVDKIIGEFQAVVKPLGDTLIDRPFLSGGSLMADGNIAYMLDPLKLIEHYD